MRAPRSPVLARALRALGALVFALVTSVLGCADGRGDGLVVTTDSSEPSGESGEDRRSPPSADASDERVAPAVRIAVKGTVATDLGEPIAERVVTAVDAEGTRSTAATDRRGSFALEAVVPPYDLAVGGRDGSGPSAYLGLRRRDPHVELFERDGPTPIPAVQIVRVGVLGLGCGTPTCIVTAVTSSWSGRGEASAECEAGADRASVLAVPHAWSALQVAPGETIDLHVLVAASDRSTFAYAHIGGIMVAPNETFDLGMLTATPVPTTPSATFRAALAPEDVLLDGVQIATDLTVDVPGSGAAPDASFLVAAVRAPGVDARLPRVPGASWRMKVTRTDPSGAAAGGLLLHRSTRAWAGGRRLDDRPPYEGTDLPVERAPELLRPAIGGALSSHGPGFAWRLGTVRTLSTVAVTDVAHGVFLGRISTNEGAIPLKRLRALGLARLERGAHAVVLTTSSRVELDEAVSPQREVRRRRFDERRAGSTTETRWSFQVTE